MAGQQQYCSMLSCASSFVQRPENIDFKHGVLAFTHNLYYETFFPDYTNAAVVK